MRARDWSYCDTLPCSKLTLLPVLAGRDDCTVNVYFMNSPSTSSQIHLPGSFMFHNPGQGAPSPRSLHSEPNSCSSHILMFIQLLTADNQIMDQAISLRWRCYIATSIFQDFIYHSLVVA